MQAMHTADMVVVFAYMAALIWVALRAGGKAESSEEFSVANGQLGFPMLLGTLIATVVGAASTLGRAGKAYDVGILIALSGAAYGVGLLAFSYLAPTIKRAGFWSVPDALGVRYGKTLRIVTAVIILIALVGLFASQLIALGLTSTIMMSGNVSSYAYAVVICAVVMTLYTLLGGMKSVATADMMHVVVIVTVIGLTLPAILIWQLGGLAAALGTIPPADGDWLGGMTPTYLFSLFLIDVPVVLIDASLWQKTGAARTLGDVRKAARITAFFFIAWGVLIAAIGVFARVLEPGLIARGFNADAVLPMLILDQMPMILRGLGFAALLAVMISTAATAMLVGGTMAGFEVLRGLKPGASDRAVLLTMRLATAGIALAGALIALRTSGVFDLLLLAMAIYVSGVFVPTLCALFWSGATRHGAFAASIIGALAVVVLQVMKSAGRLNAYVEPVIGGLVLSALAMWLVSAATRRTAGTTPRLYDRNTKDGPSSPLPKPGA